MIYKILLFIAIYSIHNKYKSKKEVEKKEENPDARNFKNNKDKKSKISREMSYFKNDLENEINYYMEDERFNSSNDKNQGFFTFIKNAENDIKRQVSDKELRKNKSTKKRISDKAKTKDKEKNNEYIKSEEERVERNFLEEKKEDYDEFLNPKDFEADQLIKSIIMKEILDKPKALRDE